MGLPALVLPEKFLAPELPDGVKERFHSGFGVAWKQLAARARGFRAPDESEEERQLLHLFGTLMLPTVANVGLTVEVLRAAMQRALDDLLNREIAASEVAKKSALRRLGQALYTFGAVLEIVAEVESGLSDNTRADLFRLLSAPKPPEKLEGDPTFRLFLRWELAMMMGFEAIEWPVAELSYWAHRATALSLRIEALRTTMMNDDTLRSQLARVIYG